MAEKTHTGQRRDKLVEFFLCLPFNSSTLYYQQTPTRRYGHAFTPLRFLPITGHRNMDFCRLWNGMFDRHRAEITVMQFTCHSLPVHHFVTARWDFYLVPYCQPSSPTRSFPITGHGNVSLPPSLEWHVRSSSSGNNCHAVHKSLSSGASLCDGTVGFLPCPILSAKLAYAISSHNWPWQCVTSAVFRMACLIVIERK